MATIYDFTVPVYLHGLDSLSACLRKASEHAEANKITPAALLNARLFPDMFPLTQQVQTVCDQAKRGTARLLGMEAPAYEDNETSFEELQARIAKTADFIKSHDASAFASAEQRTIELKMRTETMTMSAVEFVRWFSLPNFFFHLTTAYNILRHNGVPLGKRDFLGPRE